MQNIPNCSLRPLGSSCRELIPTEYLPHLRQITTHFTNKNLDKKPFIPRSQDRKFPSYHMYNDVNISITQNASSLMHASLQSQNKWIEVNIEKHCLLLFMSLGYKRIMNAIIKIWDWNWRENFLLHFPSCIKIEIAYTSSYDILNSLSKIQTEYRHLPPLNMPIFIEYKVIVCACCYFSFLLGLQILTELTLHRKICLQ